MASRPAPPRPPPAARPTPRRPNAPAPRPTPAPGSQSGPPLVGGQATSQQLEQYFQKSVDGYAAANSAYLKDQTAYEAAYRTDPENEAVLIPIIMRLRNGAQRIDKLRTDNARSLPGQYRTPNFADDIGKFKELMQMWSEHLQEEIQEAREEGQTVTADGRVTGAAATAPGQDTGFGKPPGMGGMPTRGRGAVPGRGDAPGRGRLPTRGRGTVPVRGRGGAPGPGGVAGQGRGTIPGQAIATGYPPKPLPATVPGQGTAPAHEMTDEEEMNMANSWSRTVTVDPTAKVATEQVDSQFAPPPTGDDSVPASSNGAGGRFGDPIPGQAPARAAPRPQAQRPGVDRAGPAQAQTDSQFAPPPTGDDSVAASSNGAGGRFGDPVPGKGQPQAKGAPRPQPQRPGVDRARPAPRAPTQGRYPTGDDSVPASSNGTGGRYPPPTGDDSVPASSG